MKKAKWRAAQGLGIQEGMEGDLERLGFNKKGGREGDEADKKNRDWVKVMGRVKAAAGAVEGGEKDKGKE